MPRSELCTAGAAVAIGVAALGSDAPCARADDGGDYAPPSATQVGVEDLVDMTNILPVFTYLEPDSAAGVVRASSGSTAFGGGASLYGVRVGKQWGRVDVVQGGVTVLADGNHTSVIVPLNVARVEAQYLCRTSDGYTWVWPAVTDLLARSTGGPTCSPEWLGYYADIASLRFRPDFGHVGLKAADAGVFANVADTGRTPKAFREYAIVRLGAAADYVAYGSVPRPADAGGDSWAARAEVGARLGLSTDSEVFRVGIDGVWRPRFGVWDDQEAEGTATATVFVAPSYSWLLGIGLTGGYYQAHRPWMTTSEWADPASRWSAMGRLTVDVYWMHGR